MAELTRVRGVFNSPITLSGVGQMENGVTVSAGEDFLINGQEDATQNGTYTSAAGAWSRRDATTALDFGDWLRVMEGSGGMAGSIWYYDGDDAPVDGTDPISFTPQAFTEMLQPDGESLQLDFPYIGLYERSGVEGLWPFPAQKIDKFGLIEPNGIAVVEGMDGYISGGEVRVDVSGNIIISGCALWMPSVGGIVTFDEYTDPAVSANPSEMVYLYITSGEALEKSTTLPATYSAYNSLARQKTGDNTRRFLHAIRKNSAGAAYAQTHDSSTGLVHYLADTSATPFRVVSGSNATTNQSVNLGSSGSKLVPPGTRYALLRVQASGATVALGNSEDSGSPAANTSFMRVSSGDSTTVIQPLDASQTFEWANTGAGGSATIDCLGYWLRR